MIKVIRTDSTNQDFINLVYLLDKELAQRDGDDHPFYAQYNKIDNIKYAVVVYIDDVPIGCGAVKEFANNIAEVKRMYVLIEHRNKAIGGIILKELESWAAELNFSNLILETGKKQPEAIRLYQKSGYTLIPNYGQYEGIENSVCMEKKM